MAVNPEDYKALFLEESQGQLTEWEGALLALERNPEDSPQLQRLLRAVHTLKGSAGFVECGDLQTLTHDLESAVTGDGDEEPHITPELTGLLFDGLDGARAIMDAFAAGRPTGETARGVREKLSRLLADKAQKKEGGPGGLFRISIHIEAPSSERYLRALLAQTRLEELGTIIAVRPTLEELRMQDAEFEYGVVIETDAGEEDLARALSIDQVKVLHIKPHRRGESACPEPAAEEHDVSADAERGLSRADNIVRVPASKLDSMLNLVGELVVQNAGFISLARDLKGVLAGSPLVGSLVEKTEMLSRTARQLQDAVMKVRMLPAATVFSRFPRVIRDLSKSTGKEIRLVVTGAETEIDKKVVDRMSEPLVHLVRNAADHGIESEEDRLAAGKDPVGVIRLSAFQEGDRICVEVSDDGRGLDRQRIINVAVARGLVRPDEVPTLSDDALTGLIFLPGFSTAPEVSDISGRGVGLDVVRKFVEDMDGSLRVHTETGLGTTMTITLPLTMAIIRALLVEDTGLLYAIPLTAVSEVVAVAPGSFSTVRGDKVIMLREELLPVVPLQAVLKAEHGEAAAPEAADPAGPVIVVKHGSHRVGVGVGAVVGSSEVVIKSLGRHYQEVEGLLGVSILGNGRMAIILDVGVLLEMHFAGSAGGTGGTSGTSGAGSAARVREPAAASPQPAQTTLPASRAASVRKPKVQAPISVPATARDRAPSDPPAAPDAAPAEPEAVAEAVEYPGRFVEILSTGALAASESLSGLLHEGVRVTFPELKFVPLVNVASQLGGEDRPVVRVYVGLSEGVVGGHLLVIPLDRALHLCDGLLSRENGATKTIGEEELSGLSELGNVLSASFLNCIADQLGTALSSEVPDVRVDMCLSAIDSILARFNEPGTDILMTTTEVLAGEEDQTVCHMLLFLDRPSLALLQGSVGPDFAVKADG